MNRGFQIAFFGSSLISAYWNGAATYYRGILKWLHALGHSIVFFEPDAYDRKEHRDIPDPDYALSVIYPADGENGVRNVLRRATDADIIIKASGVGVFDELLEKAVLDLKRADNLIVYWDVDAPATLDRINGNPSDPFRNLIPEYDLILTYGGGYPVIAAYRDAGARRCCPIYNALDPETHYPVAPDPRFEGLLAFLGNRMPDREDRVREFFFKTAQALASERFLLGGSGWESGVPDLPNVRRLGHIKPSDHNAFNCTPLAVLNISRKSMAEKGFSPATRVFEVAGSASCLITDKWDGIELFLLPGEECLVAENSEGVVRCLKTLSREEAREIGRRARKRVLAEHTYQRRALETQNIFYEVFSK